MQGTVFLDRLETGLTEDMKLIYETIETPIDPAITGLWGEAKLTYGVSVTKFSDSGTENATIKDISTDKAYVERLVALLRRGMVTPVCVAEVVEDYMGLPVCD